jgi:hypothetical protein
MSLINDALKKAQHQRTGPATDQPPMPGTPQGYRAAQLNKPGRGMPSQTLALILAGLAAIIVAGVVIVLVTRRTPAPAPAPLASLPPAAPRIAPVEPAASPPPPVVAVVPAPQPTVAIALPKISIPSPAPPAVEVKAPEPEVAAATPAPVPAAEPVKPVAPGVQDIRILTLLDALRVTGIRASGKESKVLMNDRVYRVNDMVDYALGIRLTGVANESLTFADVNGTVYVKNF